MNDKQLLDLINLVGIEDAVNSLDFEEIKDTYLTTILRTIEHSISVLRGTLEVGVAIDPSADDEDVISEPSTPS